MEHKAEGTVCASGPRLSGDSDGYWNAAKPKRCSRDHSSVRSVFLAWKVLAGDFVKCT